MQYVYGRSPPDPLQAEAPHRCDPPLVGNAAVAIEEPHSLTVNLINDHSQVLPVRRPCRFPDMLVSQPFPLLTKLAVMDSSAVFPLAPGRNSTVKRPIKSFRGSGSHFLPSRSTLVMVLSSNFTGLLRS